MSCKGKVRVGGVDGSEGHGDPRFRQVRPAMRGLEIGAVRFGSIGQSN